MIRFLISIILLSLSLLVKAQATDFVIDIQTPGWLSSKIRYTDQQSLKKLKVTGYINETDLAFIGSLFAYNLRIVDLSDVSIVGDSWNGRFNEGTESYYPYKLQKLILPKSLSTYKEDRQYTPVDSFFYYSRNNKIIRNTFVREINHLFIGEGVDSLMQSALYNNPLQSLHLPQSLKYIATRAISNVLEDVSSSNITMFPNLEYLEAGAVANRGTSMNSNQGTLPDTILFPQIIDFNITAFDYREGMHLFLVMTLNV